MCPSDIEARWAWLKVILVDSSCALCGGLLYVLYGHPLAPGAQGPPGATVRCSNCGAVSVAPSSRRCSSADYYEASGYWERMVELGVAEQRLAKCLGILTEHVGALRGRRVLDLGAGCGIFVALARRAEAEALGVEMRASAVRCAAEKLRVHLVHESIESFVGWSEVGHWDIVTLWEIVEHVADPVELLRSVRGLLGGEGVLVVSTPHYTRVHALLDTLRTLCYRCTGQPWRWPDDADHFHVFTPQALRRALERAGFAVVALMLVEHDYGTAVATWRRLLKRSLARLLRLRVWPHAVRMEPRTIVAIAGIQGEAPYVNATVRQCGTLRSEQ